MSNINWLSFSTSSSNLIPRKTLCVKTPPHLQICSNWTFCRFSREPSPLLAFPLSPLIFPHVEIGVLKRDKELDPHSYSLFVLGRVNWIGKFPVGKKKIRKLLRNASARSRVDNFSQPFLVNSLFSTSSKMRSYPGRNSESNCWGIRSRERIQILPG